MIIDSHLHIGLNKWTEDSLISYLDKKEISKAWILTWDEADPAIPIYYVPLDIKLVKKAYKKYPDRLVPFYAPDPKRSDWKERLSSCLDEGFAGCGELKVPYRWDDKTMEGLLEFLNERKLPLIFHMEKDREYFIPKKDRGADWLFKRLINERFNGKMNHFLLGLKRSTGFLQKYLDSHLIDFPGYMLDFESLEHAAEKYRDIQFIAHGPHVWNNFSIPRPEYLFHQKGKFRGEGKLWKLLKNHENMYCDLSGFSCYNALGRDRQATERFFHTFHQKILFGTDNTDLELMDFIKGFELTQSEYEAIFYKNAESILAR